MNLYTWKDGFDIETGPRFIYAVVGEGSIDKSYIKWVTADLRLYYMTFYIGDNLLLKLCAIMGLWKS